MKPLDLIILLLTVSLSACQDKQKEAITLLVKEWQG
ncbi:putative lipoprotein, partial [Parabacteroides distasonis str. 3999B T(B) 4]